MALTIYLLSLFMPIPFYAIIFWAMVVIGFLPGIFGFFGLRMLGFVGFLGIIIALVWSIISALISRGWIWPFFFILDVVKVFLIMLFLGCLVQIFFTIWRPIKKKNYTFDVD